MKIQNIKKGFTLIELLVVITIIGILATGATAVYTSQIQKARDSTRITDMTSLRGSLEQAFQDMSFYPGKATTKLATTTCDSSATMTNSSVYCLVKLGFMNSLPKDPKDGQAGNGSTLVYTYNSADVNGVLSQAFEISTGVESTGFRTSKALNAADGGDDDNRVEFGMTGTIPAILTCTAGVGACPGTGESTSTIITAATNASCTLLGSSQVLVRGDCL